MNLKSIKKFLHFADANPSSDFTTEQIPTANKLFFSGLSFQKFVDPKLLKEQGRRFYWMFQRMMTDDRLRAGHDFKLRAILANPYKITPASEDAEDQKIADFVKENLDNLEIPLPKVLENMCDAWVFGYKVAEKIYYEQDNFFMLKAIKCKPSYSIEFETDDFSNLTSINFTGVTPKIKIDPSKFVTYIHPYLKDGYWYGESDFCAIYREWWAKDVLVKIRNIALRTHGMPIRQVVYDKEMPNARLDEIKNAVDDVHENLALYIPAIKNEEGLFQPIFDLKFLESTKNITNEYNATIEQLDNAMLRRLLIGEQLGLQQVNHGSYALGGVHFDLFMDGVVKECKTTLCDIMNRDVVKQLVDFNFPNADYPKFEFDEPATDMDAKMQVIGMAIDKGIVNPAEEWVRPLIGFPKPAPGVVIPGFNKNVVDLGSLFAGKGNDKGAGNPQQKPQVNAPTSGATGNKTYQARLKKVTNFRRIKSGMDANEKRAVDKLANIFKQVRDDVIKQATNIHNSGKNASINGIKKSLLADVKNTVSNLLLQSYTHGKSEAMAEIKIGKGEVGNYEAKIINFDADFDSQVEQFASKTFQNKISQKAFYITGVEQDAILKRVNGILIKNVGKTTVNDTIKQVEDSFAPFVETGEIDDSVAEPWRVSTIVRTNNSEFFNDGRMEQFLDPDLGGFVQAFEYSAILDDRTTDFCESHDGEIMEADDPRLNIFPPAHYNCRSTWIPIFRGEDYTPDWNEKILPAEGFGA